MQLYNIYVYRQKHLHPLSFCRYIDTIAMRWLAHIDKIHIGRWYDEELSIWPKPAWLEIVTPGIRALCPVSHLGSWGASLRLPATIENGPEYLQYRQWDPSDCYSTFCPKGAFLRFTLVSHKTCSSLSNLNFPAQAPHPSA